MQNYIDDFVQNILTEVFISIGLNEKDKAFIFYSLPNRTASMQL